MNRRVIPAEAGIQLLSMPAFARKLDSRFRGSDGEAATS
jgi:hypothetical protein